MTPARPVTAMHWTEVHSTAEDTATAVADVCARFTDATRSAASPPDRSG